MIQILINISLYQGGRNSSGVYVTFLERVLCIIV
jgi:hypothetical protein